MGAKVSIITVNLNNHFGLNKTIQSVLRQDYSDLEFIVIDGGSTDGSKEFLYSNSDHISWWVSEKDNGVYDAMNKGVMRSTGDYLVFLNSGDCFANESSVAKLISVSKGKDLVYGDLLIDELNGSWIKKYPDQLSLRYFYYESIPHPACLISRRLFLSLGLYDTSLKIVSDWKFFVLSVLKKKCTYCHIDQVITVFDFQGISSIGSNRSRVELERRSVLKEHFGLFYYLYSIYLKLIGKSFYQKI